MKKKVIAILSSIVIFLGGFGSSWLLFGQKKEASNEVASVSDATENTAEQKSDISNTESQQSPITTTAAKSFDFGYKPLTLYSADNIELIGDNVDDDIKVYMRELFDKYDDSEPIEGCEDSFRVSISKLYGKWGIIGRATCGGGRSLVGLNSETGKVEDKIALMQVPGCQQLDNLNLPQEVRNWFETCDENN